MKSEEQRSLKDKLQTNKTLIAIGAIVTIVVVVIIITLTTIANPLEIRNKRLDGQILGDFRDINYEIEDYYDRHNTVPAYIGDVIVKLKDTLKEKFTTDIYKYNKQDNEHFQLCATFSGESNPKANVNRYNSYDYGDDTKHKKGYDCIKYEVIKKGNNYTLINPVE